MLFYKCKSCGRHFLSAGIATHVKTHGGKLQGKSPEEFYEIVNAQEKPQDPPLPKPILGRPKQLKKSDLVNVSPKIEETKEATPPVETSVAEQKQSNTPTPQAEEFFMNGEEITKDKLLTTQTVEVPEVMQYGCQKCGTPVNKGIEQCPYCGAVLNWEGV